MAQQHTCATGDSATHDSELARLRSELAVAKTEACLDADKLAAALEACRYHPFLVYPFYLLCFVCCAFVATPGVLKSDCSA